MYFMARIFSFILSPYHRVIKVSYVMFFIVVAEKEALRVLKRQRESEREGERERESVRERKRE